MKKQKTMDKKCGKCFDETEAEPKTFSAEVCKEVICKNCGGCCYMECNI